MILTGIFKVLKPSGQDNKDWQDEFNLSAPALPRSFIAIFLSIPLFILIAKAVVKYNDNSGQVPFFSIALVLALMSLAFPLIAYLLCMVFDKQGAFRPWVIVRNWTYLLVIACIAAGFSLYLFDLFPFSAAYLIGLSLYLSTLAIDIRLAMRIAKFDWIGAVFAAVLISAAGMMVLFLGIAQVLSSAA